MPHIELLNQNFRDDVSDEEFKIFLDVLDKIGKLDT